MKSLISLALCLGVLKGLWGQPDFPQLRQRMVREQLQSRDIVEGSVLRALRKVPRHLFVPEKYRAEAYSDTPLPIGEGQTISQPYMVAFMTQALRLKGSDKVLEIGTGSGYQAAVLAELVDSVYTIEIVEPLGEAAAKRLQALGYENIQVRIGDGYHGWPRQAPFDAIIVTAGAEALPQPLVDQLAEGGRMVIPVGPHQGVRDLVLLRKKRNGKLVRESLMPVRFVPFTREN
ncbi:MULTISPECIES: protein-L-isoaspartate(D-aspartate) O-methyltransferase [unclassified Robiginitalea]|uniref:protein-L-isoaspartate(D-aspartate) O-methyltransferase n=1 Tax=Robiginitalea TaxID=252306 RepID=UPI00234BC601|nr:MULTISPECIES: protein-L-isoaspartate(D-aspartate) O-methyltransferase [unclassified Robiginitalea]MDC6354048.1 protein-L-isoaspartate(D-aspartate) O-methyltransferase [Robiginitalea sp. PM2]MDC6374315.1 protein-L-isoaspartate(D-aspartate) O-methyltransferase [Robiginitalea sp. SP8]